MSLVACALYLTGCCDVSRWSDTPMMNALTALDGTVVIIVMPFSPE